MATEKRYELVDIEGLATAMAEDAWQEEVKTKSLTKEQLYDQDGHVRPEWTYNFFSLRDGYMTIINGYKKPQDETCKEG